MLWSLLISFFHTNKAAHEGSILDVLHLSGSIRKTALTHLNTWKVSSSSQVEKWFPPRVGSSKIKFDTAIRDTFSAHVVDCCDSNENILKVISQISLPCDPNFRKALSARLVASLVISLKLTNFTLKCDSQVVVIAL